MISTELAAVPGQPAHLVSTAPFDPHAAARLTPEQERFYLASQWKLMWWKFKRHRVAVVSGIILLVMYGSTLVSEVLVPYNLHTRHVDFIYAPPQSVHWIHDGHFAGPFVYELKKTLNMETLRRDYTEDTSRPHSVRFFCSGDPYKFWGLVDASFHLICPDEGATLFLLGTDRLGRDTLSRIVYGARISLTIGLRARTHHRRHRRLFRRLGGPADPAPDRDHPLVSRAASLDGAVRGAARDLEPDPHLFRDHGNPGDARMDGACASGPVEAPGAA